MYHYDTPLPFDGDYLKMKKIMEIGLDENDEEVLHLLTAGILALDYNLSEQENIHSNSGEYTYSGLCLSLINSSFTLSQNFSNLTAEASSPVIYFLGQLSDEKIIELYPSPYYLANKKALRPYLEDILPLFLIDIRKKLILKSKNILSSITVLNIGLNYEENDSFGLE